MIKISRFHLHKVASGEIRCEVDFSADSTSEKNSFECFLRSKNFPHILYLVDGLSTMIISFLLFNDIPRFKDDLEKIACLPLEYENFASIGKYIKIAEEVLKTKHSLTRLGGY